jgi:hypothetical protein
MIFDIKVAKLYQMCSEHTKEKPHVDIVYIQQVWMFKFQQMEAFSL